MAATVRLRNLRGIMKELKLLYGSKGPTRNIFGYSFLMSEYRRSLTVDEEIAVELNRDADNFLCLLNSERKKQELISYYKGSGESTVEKVARRVGFEMPNTFQRTDENASSKT